MTRAFSRSPLILAIGNPSRGDDALGPALAAALIDEGLVRDLDEPLGATSLIDPGAPAAARARRPRRKPRVDLLQDFQLQPEHAAMLYRRRGVLIVDAALPLSLQAPIGALLGPLQAARGAVPCTHALAPAALLQVTQALDGSVPPAWLLAVGGLDFSLGAPLSDTARRHLRAALVLARAWCEALR